MVSKQYQRHPTNAKKTEFIGLFDYFLLFPLDTGYNIYHIFICIIALFHHLNLVNNVNST